MLRKKRGVVIDFLISLRGVFIMKHVQPFGSLSIDLNSVQRAGIVISSTKSIGFLPYLSFTSLDAPLINNDLTGLVLLKDSTLFTAKCKGVNPSISCSLKSCTQLRRQQSAISDFEQQAQCIGVLFLLSLLLMSRPFCLKK